MTNSNRSPLPFWSLLTLMAAYPYITASTQDSGKRLKLPEVPAIITDPDKQTEYTVIHYWQHYDFTDTTLMNDAGYTEEAFIEFCDILSCVPDTIAHTAIESLMLNASIVPEMFSHFTKLTDHYLGHADSPQCNEDLYILALETIVSLPSVDWSLKIHPRHQLILARQYQPGTIATNLTYTTPTGEERKLHDLNCDYTLLLLYDPECPSCKNLCRYNTHTPVFRKSVAGQVGEELTVLAFHSGDDLRLWSAYLSEIFGGWIMVHALDTELENEKLEEYTLPCLCLLDKDKQVLLKGASMEQIETWIKKK